MRFFITLVFTSIFFAPASVLANEFDENLCYKKVQLKPHEKYTLFREASGGLAFHKGNGVNGYVLEGEITRIWTVKKGLFHWGKTKTRKKNVVGAFKIGASITDMVSGSVKLRAVSGSKPTSLCLCWANTNKEYERLDRESKSAGYGHATGQSEYYRKAIKKRDMCRSMVKKLLPIPKKKEEKVNRSFRNCPGGFGRSGNECFHVQ